MPRRELYIRFIEIPFSRWAGPIVLEDGEEIKRIERFGQWLIIQIQTPIPPPTIPIRQPTQEQYPSYGRQRTLWRRGKRRAGTIYTD
jgi:hypothetical protein